MEPALSYHVYHWTWMLIMRYSMHASNSVQRWPVELFLMSTWYLGQNHGHADNVEEHQRKDAPHLGMIHVCKQ